MQFSCTLTESNLIAFDKYKKKTKSLKSWHQTLRGRRAGDIVSYDVARPWQNVATSLRAARTKCFWRFQKPFLCPPPMLRAWQTTCPRSACPWIQERGLGSESPCTVDDSSNAHLLHVDLDVLLQVVAVKVQHQVVNEVEAVAHDDERQLIGQFRFLRNKTSRVRLGSISAPLSGPAFVPPR